MDLRIQLSPSLSSLDMMKLLLLLLQLSQPPITNQMCKMRFNYRGSPKRKSTGFYFCLVLSLLSPFPSLSAVLIYLRSKQCALYAFPLIFLGVNFR